jgi:hypothetical protein
MLRRISVILGVFVGAAVLPVAASAAPLPPAGIYQVWGKDASVSKPYIKGGQITVEWAAIQPSHTTFDWSSLDSKLAYFNSIGKVATVQINSTTAKPAWVFKVVSRCGAVKGQDAPQYWDPKYLAVQSDLVTALAAHLKSSPYKSTVALVRASPNAIGTELTDLPAGYRCVPAAGNKNFAATWSKDIRNAYYYDVMNLYRQALLPEINVALRVQVWTQWPGHSPTDWLGAAGAWMMGTASDPDPDPVRDAFDLFAFNKVKLGSGNAYWEQKNGTKRNLVSWEYWRILMELHKGTRAIAVYGSDLAMADTNPEFRATFDFANRYAGFQADPATSPGAWVALRQGSGRLPGNYSLHMQQLNADATSIGLNSNSGASPIGNPAQRYGRHARQIAGGTAKDAMSFVLDPAFKTGIATSTTTLRVVYLDAGTASFEVRWGVDSAITVDKTGSGNWKTLEIPVAGLAYTGSLAGGADIVVKQLGTGSTNFHMVEVAVDGR